MITCVARRGEPIPLGHQGEALARRIVFSVAAWREAFGAGTVRLLHQRQGDPYPYPVPVTMEEDGNRAVWTVSGADTDRVCRYGKAELRYYVGDALVKSDIWQTSVLESLGAPTAEAPEQEAHWIEDLLDAAGSVQDAVRAAASDAERAARYADALELAAVAGGVAVDDTLSHTGEAADAKAAGDALAGKVPDTRTVNGHALSADVALTAADVGARPDTWTPSAADVGAVSAARTVNGYALSSDVTLAAADVGARSGDWTPSAADVGAVPAARTVNGYALSSDVTLTASDVGAVPVTRTVAGKALSSDVTLTAADVGARSGDWTPSAADVGAVPAARTVNGYALSSDVALTAADVGAVPDTRKVAGKTLSSDVTLTASDVGARGDNWTPSAADVGAVPAARTVNGYALSSDVTLTASDVGARPDTWTPSAADVGAVPVARTVNGYALSSDVALTAADVGAVPDTRKVAGKTLSSDVTLTASDVGARGDNWTPSAADVGAVPAARTVNGYALSADVTLAAADVGAVPAARTVNGYALSSDVTLTAADVGAVPVTRTVAGKALSANVILTAADVGAVSALSVGTANGVAELDSYGRVPAAQLPATALSDTTYSLAVSGTPGLSTNNYTDAEKAKLAGISANASGLSSVALPVTVSGDYASFNADAGRTLNPLLVQINPVQAGSGDPSPSNPRAISGWTGCKVARAGKNLMPIQEATVSSLYNNLDFDHPLPSGQYTFSALVESTDTDDTTCLLSIYDVEGNQFAVQFARNVRQSYTFTSSSPVERILLYASSWGSGGDGDTAIWHDMQMEEGEAATSYELGEKNNISFGIAGTVYGGTLDVARGLLTVTHNFKSFNGSENWTIDVNDGVKYVYLGGVVGDRFERATTYRLYGYSNFSLTRAGGYLGYIYAAGANSTTLVVDYIDTLFGADVTLESFKTFLSATPLQLVYKIASPVTYHLTPQQITTLLGTNHVWADCGPVSVTYPAGSGTPVLTEAALDTMGGAASYEDLAAKYQKLVDAIVALGGNIP